MIYKTADFTQMIGKLEKSNKNIVNGSILYYTISKFDLCDEYSPIISRKIKWQLFLEDFNKLNLDKKTRKY
jgi:hypothetical protein